MVFLKEFFQKIHLEKISRQQKCMKNYAVGNELGFNYEYGDDHLLKSHNIFQTNDIVFEKFTEVATQEICNDGEQRLADGTCGK